MEEDGEASPGDGDAGYIGSRTCKCLAARGIEPVVYNNISRGHSDAVDGDHLSRAI
jgi:UDP-glucose 4-epimerase